MDKTQTDKLKEYKELLDAGVLTQAEFDTAKQEVLAAPNVTNITNVQVAPESAVNRITNTPVPTGVQGNKSKIAAALLAIFLGSYGVHNFYLGYRDRGLAQLILTIIGWVTMFFLIGFVILTITWIWGLVEGFLILTSQPGSPRHLDADGNELQD